MEDCSKLSPLRLRLRILELAHKAGSNGAHLGGALSLVEILCALYGVASVDPTEHRDRVILSKGHGALALYTALEAIGMIDTAELDTFESTGTKYYAHARRDISHGIEFSGGSLSLGISFAVGAAIASKSKGLTSRIYCIVGDGECDEGLVWEAAMAASHYHLDNLTVIVDCNRMQSDGDTAQVMDTGSLAEKFRAFGFAASEVDGHDVAALTRSLSEPSDRPTAIIARTVKGKGVSFCENAANWHHGVLSDKLYQQALAELQPNP